MDILVRNYRSPETSTEVSHAISLVASGVDTGAESLQNREIRGKGYLVFQNERESKKKNHICLSKAQAWIEFP